MIEGLSGGINIPSTMFFDLNTTATNLMRLGIVGISALGQVGNIVSGISNIVPSTMLTKLGITSSAQSISRGSGLGRKNRLTQQVSSSNMIGNSAGEDYEDSIVTQAEAEASEKVDAQRQEMGELTVNNIHEYLVGVFDKKITAITQMLGSMSGYKVESSQ